MRTVSFIEYVEFDFEGNVMNKAFTIGDIDNDNNNEIVIGNTIGDLFVFKTIQDSRPWAKANKLGMIACLEIGDITNRGTNCLVSLSTEGWCHIFYLTPDIALHSTLCANQEGDVGLDATEFTADNIQAESFNVINLPSTDEKYIQQLASTAPHTACQQLNFDAPPSPVQGQAHTPIVLKPAYTHKLSSNAKAFVIADIDGDGCNELIVSFTDRVVRSFKWVPEIPTYTTTSHNTPTISPSTPGSTNFCFGALVIHEKWKLAGQVGSMSVHKNPSGGSVVLVSQPGGSYVSLVCSNDEQQGVNDSINEQNKTCCGPSVCYHPLGSPRARNTNMSTEVISNIVGKMKDTEDGLDKKIFSAICTLDGTLTLLDGDNILWSLYVDHQLFALTKLDVTGDGTEEVVACSWDGQTYIVNLSKEVARFHFKENVAAFCSGTFSIAKDQPSSVLCYATFNEKVVVYYNINLNNIGIPNMVGAITGRPDIVEDLKKLDVDVTDREQLKRFIGEVMYEPIGKLQ